MGIALPQNAHRNISKKSSRPGFSSLGSDKHEECTLPLGMNLNVATQDMTTDLHMDGQHMNFISAMCEGVKEWVVISPAQVKKHFQTFKPYLQAKHSHEVDDQVVRNQFLVKIFQRNDPQHRG